MTMIFHFKQCVLLGHTNLISVSILYHFMMILNVTDRMARI